MRALSLFSGISGLDLAAHAAGIETVAFCEIEPFAVQVLERRFPAIENHGDITRFTNRRLRELGGSPFLRFKCPADYDGTIDVVHGGFPCQDLSVAGKQKGLSGERSGLWYEMLRVISELRPAYVLAENVRGAVNLALDTVYSGLVGEGYKVYPYVIPASAVGAPHQRERLFVLGVREDVADTYCKRYIHRQSKVNTTEAGVDAQCNAPTGCTSMANARCGEGGGALWPTPTSTERSGINTITGRGGGLSNAVSLWRTPDAKCMRGASSDERMKWKRENGMPISINDQVGKGSLNPAWVEILMGFPLGWTDPDCDEPEPWPGWPAGMGELQYPYEPPRTGRNIPHRAARLRALGNAVVPAQAYPFFEAIKVIEEVTK